MTTAKLDAFFSELLDIPALQGIDPSLNGLQVDNDGGEIRKAAFAVDASLESFRRAVAGGAGLLFVHHGLFWKEPLRVRGNHRGRLKFLLDNNLALYGAHLPLDRHPQWGNNAVLGELLGLRDIEPFGLYRGCKIGFKGRLEKPLRLEEAVSRIGFMGREPLGVYPFGREESRSAGVVSGGASGEALQAMEEGLDLYVTGEVSHEVYHQVLEGGLNLIAGGHYSTEVWGVRRVMEQCAQQLDLDVEFLDIPTGL
jgi:dinuclear metal center YbgI/SA1388 family protein